jgi:gluconolactonase
MKLEVREITDGLLFPEGPIAMADGSVLVVEIKGGRLIRVQPDGRKETVAELGGGPNGAAIGPDGQCYICKQRRL